MSLSRTTVAFLPVARTTFDIPLAQEVTRQARARLEGLGLRLIGPDVLVTDLESATAAADRLAEARPALLVLFQATFADSTMVQRVAEAVDAPLVLWAVPEDRTGGRLRLNSLCGINLAAHALTRAGRAYEHLYAAPESPQVEEKLLPLVRAAGVRQRLASARIGRFGVHPDGFESCQFTPERLAGRFGLAVVQIELEDVFGRVRGLEPARIAPVEQALAARVAGLGEVDQAALRGTLGTYLALRALAQEARLDGLAVRCWPQFFTDLGCAACGALSMLNDELLPCSCEADIHGAITQLILQELSGAQAFDTDLVGFYPDEDLAVLWHCGKAPLAMADPEFQPRATIHSNRRLPLLMEFPLRPGRVTLARLSESQGELSLVVGRGEMRQAPPSFSGTSGVIRFERPAQDVLDTILSTGLEHHVALTYGDYVDELLMLARLLGLPVIRL